MKKLILYSMMALMHAAAYSQTVSWVEGMGGSSADGGLSIATDPQGNVYTTGFFKGTADFDPGPGTYNLTSNGDYDFYVSKLDAQGNFVWAIGLGGSGADFSLNMTLDANGNLYIAGSFSGITDFDPGSSVFNLSSNGGTDAFLLSLDQAGGFLWAIGMGDGGNDQVNSIKLDPSGNIYTTGYFAGVVDFDPGPGSFNLGSFNNSQDVFVSLYDPTGNFFWAEQIGGTGLENAESIALDASGNIYVSGYFGSAPCDFDPGLGTYNISSGSAIGNGYVCKLDGAGNFLWASAFLGSGICDGISSNVDLNGGVVVSGYFFNGIDFDPGPATSLANASNGSSDIFVTSLDAVGNLKWTRNMGSSGGDEIENSIIDPQGNIYSIGGFNGTVDFNPGAGVFNLSSYGSDDIFVCGLDSAGNFISAYDAGSSGSEFGCELTRDASGALLATGNFVNTAYFDATQTIPPLISNGGTDAFVLKLQGCSNLIAAQPANKIGPLAATVHFTINASPGSSFQWQVDAGTGFTNLSNAGQFSGVNTATLTIAALSLSQNADKFRCVVSDGGCSITSAVAALSVYDDTGLQNLSEENPFLIYPNPAIDAIQLKTKPELTGLLYTVCDQTGQLVLSGKLTGSTTPINIQGLPKGLYFLSIGDPKQRPMKVVKQ